LKLDIGSIPRRFISVDISWTCHIARVVKSIGKFEHASLQINFGTIDVGEAPKSMRCSRCASL
jgi:hypothetical protein